MKTDKLAEKILENTTYGNMYEIMEREELIKAMQAYHKDRVNRVTDEDIEKRATDHATFIGFDGKPNINIARQVSYMQGAKAMRDGEIKHT